MAVYGENHTKHTLWVKCSFSMLKHWALKGYSLYWRPTWIFLYRCKQHSRNVCKCRTPQNNTTLCSLHTRSHAGPTTTNLQLSVQTRCTEWCERELSRRASTDEEAESGEIGIFSMNRKRSLVWRTRRLSVVYIWNLQLQKPHGNAELLDGPVDQQRYCSIWLTLSSGFR
jgi:hypothetical protein